MPEKLEYAKKKLDEKFQAIQLKEKLIKEREKKREKKLRSEKLKDISKLASKANLDEVDSQVLLGAFLEISQKKDDKESIERWNKQADQFLNFRNQTNLVTLSIKFKGTPNPSILDIIKEKKFIWNRFRKEFYGYGVKDELSKLLDGVECTIEIIE